MTSEERLELPAQPCDTCPLLDDMLERMYEARKHIKSAKKSSDSVDELKGLLTDLESSLTDDGEEQIEIIRKHVISIRKWGQSWKDAYLDMERGLRNDSTNQDNHR